MISDKVYKLSKLSSGKAEVNHYELIDLAPISLVYLYLIWAKI